MSKRSERQGTQPSWLMNNAGSLEQREQLQTEDMEDIRRIWQHHISHVVSESSAPWTHPVSADVGLNAKWDNSSTHLHGGPSIGVEYEYRDTYCIELSKAICSIARRRTELRCLRGCVLGKDSRGNIGMCDYYMPRFRASSLVPMLESIRKRLFDGKQNVVGLHLAMILISVYGARAISGHSGSKLALMDSLTKRVEVTHRHVNFL